MKQRTGTIGVDTRNPWGRGGGVIDRNYYMETKSFCIKSRSQLHINEVTLADNQDAMVLRPKILKPKPSTVCFGRDALSNRCSVDT
jgi:hypothetical protein